MLANRTKRGPYECCLILSTSFLLAQSSLSHTLPPPEHSIYGTHGPLPKECTTHTAHHPLHTRAHSTTHIPAGSTLRGIINRPPHFIERTLNHHTHATARIPSTFPTETPNRDRSSAHQPLTYLTLTTAPIEIPTPSNQREATLLTRISHNTTGFEHSTAPHPKPL